MSRLTHVSTDEGHIAPNAQWRADVSTSWDVLGPFPIQAREQHFLSPSFPLDLSRTIDFNRTWPSSYADGGNVSWSKYNSDNYGNIKVSYPRIRWESIRATEGWAGLQHHSVLRTTITVFPPSRREVSLAPPRLRVELLQGSYFAIVPSAKDRDDDSPKIIPEWYSGNIYALERSPLQTVTLPFPPSTTSPTDYDVYISGDYEIRLFGDPTAYNSKIPILSINFHVEIEPAISSIVREPMQDVVCDFVDGMAFGDAIGVGLRSIDGWWAVTSATLRQHQDKQLEQDIVLSLIQVAHIAPTQTGIIPIHISQTKNTKLTELPIDLTVVSESTSFVISLTLPIKHHVQWTPTHYEAIKATYFFVESMPTAFLALPPKQPNLDSGSARAPILALHGAGVDIFEHTFWPDSLPRQGHSWIIMPTGRTSWVNLSILGTNPGLDWHGPSAQDAWATINALHHILSSNEGLKDWTIPNNMKVVLIGHSNGGQGAWFLASRYPDRVLGVVPAAGYIKSQASAHYIDPSLRSILESSLTPDDNDLFLSNLVDTPVLAIHGGNDDNVPTWHTREAVSVLKTWKPSANVTYREDAGQPHWYPSIFKNDQVRDFLESAASKTSQYLRHMQSFTLTVAIPAESGSLHGWQILGLQVPGRMARLRVTVVEGAVQLEASNIELMSVSLTDNHITEVHVNGGLLTVPRTLSDKIWFHYSSNSWKITDTDPGRLQHFGRLQALLNTAGHIIIIVPVKQASTELSVALRIAHDVMKFHKLSAEIICSSEAVERYEDGRLGRGNIVVVGGAQSPFVKKYIETVGCSFKFSSDSWVLTGHKTFNKASSGILFTQPHPSHISGTTLFLMSTDHEGLERAARILPIRTGIAVPDWIVADKTADQTGAAGVQGAGLNSNSLVWNEHMSWVN
ncbi:hypothetical protein SERLA73DRAFT_124984 [Serpula lacrymans var. lacrymans S7.3]|uniref:Peptidase S9 prolyl oligopeptidase catalytic domain-containing protein n=2 Tax=Serpula lacrymans var. lacrymans TaxID=341189 RepID=F8Q6A4_SERL3|nr:uncharacterized protein SERLADRAFT_372325 [Serpula lacrymans var. lacrymans S7.9]EGN96142.1 hypothetical protein SERLA73DRAFT_124984 [Serpula lacrymans var. lacrymans S7.3]EGO21683.1 hypothetical protein SERLADRAFT_372325 [Serpula lacrymans var. lacrymans S7.9]